MKSKKALGVEWGALDVRWKVVEKQSFDKLYGYEEIYWDGKTWRQRYDVSNKNDTFFRYFDKSISEKKAKQLLESKVGKDETKMVLELAKKVKK